MRKGRSKIYLRKIEDTTKSQVTFCKHRSGLAKKVDEVSILCDVDIAFIAFSPTARSVHLYSHNRFEDVLLRYIDVPINKRNYKIDNPEEKLKEVEHITKERDRVAFLKNRISHLQEQLSNLRTKIVVHEAEASNFQPGLQILSLSEALWREQYLEATLKIVNDIKIQMMNKRSTNPFSYNQTMINQISFGFDTPNTQEVNNDGLPTTWISESQPQCQTPVWHNGQSSQRLGEENIWNEIIHGNQHEEAMGMRLIDQNHTWVNPMPLFIKSKSLINPMLTPPLPMLPFNQQLLIMGDKNYIPNPEQQKAYDPSSFMNNQNWQEGIQLPTTPSMSNFNQQGRNWFPNASSSSFGQNLNAPGLAANPPRIPSILSVYDPSNGSHVDSSMKVLLENPNIAVATTTIKNNNRIAASNKPISTPTINYHQAAAAAACNYYHPIATTINNNKSTLNADIFYHPICINNSEEYNHSIQNQDTVPPPTAAQAHERASSSDSAADHDMIDEEIEALIDSLLANPEDFKEAGF